MESIKNIMSVVLTPGIYEAKTNKNNIKQMG
jgi:hypothetical protein